MKPELLVVLPVLWGLATAWPAAAQDVARKPSHAGPPGRPRPPAERRALPPIEEPYRTEVERRDLLQRFDPPGGLAGFYRLVRYVRPGMPPAEAEGYLVVGRRHLSLHLYGSTGDPRMPAIQTGFRRYDVSGDTLRMTTLVGLRNRPSGTIVLEPPGHTEVRRFKKLGTTLRIYHGRAYYEFVRIE